MYFDESDVASTSELALREGVVSAEMASAPLNLLGLSGARSTELDLGVTAEDEGDDIWEVGRVGATDLGEQMRARVAGVRAEALRGVVGANVLGVNLLEVVEELLMAFDDLLWLWEAKGSVRELSMIVSGGASRMRPCARIPISH